MAKLTPVPVNRDAMLFAAGRASAPRGGFWKWLCAGLVVTQVGTLALCLLPPKSPPAVTPVLSTPAVEEQPTTPLEPSSYLALHKSNLDQPPLSTDDSRGVSRKIWSAHSTMDWD
jgi:hypothetical protein